MKTQNTRYDNKLIGLHDDADNKIMRFGDTPSDFDSADESSRESTSAGIFAYIAGLAAIAVVTTTGQFPWFLLALALPIALTTVYPGMRQTRSGGKSDIAGNYRELASN